ncbi:MAG: DsbA family protein [Sphingorhabdus sp.]
MKRLPLYLAISGGLLLGGSAVYFFKDRFGAAAASDDVAATASTDATNAVAAAGMSEKDRKATEAIVRAYILDNPGIIQEAAELLQKEQLAKRLDTLGPSLSSAFAGAIDGNPNGDVTVVKFTDYNCGYCRASLPEVAKLLAKDAGVKIVYREMPILSQTSKEAGSWALAAAKQGKFRAFHKAMFNAGQITSASIRAVAKSVGLNMAAAEKFAASGEAEQELRSNVAMMQQVGFNGTPTFIIGDQILEGLHEYDVLQKAVTEARKNS